MCENEVNFGIEQISGTKVHFEKLNLVEKSATTKTKMVCLSKSKENDWKSNEKSNMHRMKCVCVLCVQGNGERANLVYTNEKKIWVHIWWMSFECNEHIESI